MFMRAITALIQLERKRFRKELGRAREL